MRANNLEKCEGIDDLTELVFVQAIVLMVQVLSIGILWIEE
jgi:hypothetical protein